MVVLRGLDKAKRASPWVANGSTVKLRDNSTWTVRSPGNYWNFRLNPDGQPIYSFELRPGEQWPNDVAVDGRQRSRLDASATVAYLTDYWFSFGLRIDASEPYLGDSTDGLGEFFTLMSFHQTADNEDEANLAGPAGLSIDDGKLTFYTRTSDLATTPSNAASTIHWQETLIYGRRYSMVGRLQFGKTSGGALDLWFEGSHEVDGFSGRIGYNDATGPYPQIGNYHSALTTTQTIKFAYPEFGTTDLSARAVTPLFGSDW